MATFCELTVKNNKAILWIGAANSNLNSKEVCCFHLEKQYVYKKNAIKAKGRQYFYQAELKKLDIFAELTLKKIELGTWIKIDSLQPCLYKTCGIAD